MLWGWFNACTASPIKMFKKKCHWNKVWVWVWLLVSIWKKYGQIRCWGPCIPQGKKYPDRKKSKMQASKYLKRLQELSKSNQNISQVWREPKFSKQDMCMNLSWPYPYPRMKLKDKTSGFTHKYPSPVAAGQLCAQSDVKGSEHDDILNVADSRETGPEDSVSNVSRSKANCVEGQS